MIPILFDSDATSFEGHGLGDLIDCIECKSIMSEEGEWEIEFRYPATGAHFSELVYGRLVLVKANHYQENYQAFRIYKIEKTINGIATIFAEHISYDLTWIPVTPFTATTATNAINAIKNNSIISHEFTLSTDLSVTEEFKLTEPSSFRKVLLDGDESIKGKYGGNLIFDNFNITLKQYGGEDREVSIDYGVDLIDLDQEINNSEMITGVLPYYRKNDDNNTCILGTVQEVGVGYVRQQIIPLDLTEYFPNSEPSSSELNAKARSWMQAENVGEPEISLRVNYAWLGQDVRLYDAVRVRMLKLGIDVKSQVSKYTYDCLKERPVEIEVGKTKDSLYFSLEDASRLRKGLLPPERIKNESITNSKLGKSSVQLPNMAPQSVSTGNIVPRSVDSGLIKLLNILSGHLAGDPNNDDDDNSAVTKNKIKKGTIDVSKFLSGVLTKWNNHESATKKVSGTISGSEGDYTISCSSTSASSASFTNIRLGSSSSGSVQFHGQEMRLYSIDGHQVIGIS